MAVRRCPYCGQDIRVEHWRCWAICPQCGHVIHFKIRKNRRLRKAISYFPLSGFFKSLFSKNNFKK